MARMLDNSIFDKQFNNRYPFKVGLGQFFFFFAHLNILLILESSFIFSFSPYSPQRKKKCKTLLFYVESQNSISDWHMIFLKQYFF